MTYEFPCPPADRERLRQLARRVADIAASPGMAQRRADWARVNGLRGGRPMIVVETFGANTELKAELALQCESPWARTIEGVMREKLFHYDFVKDDVILEPTLNVGTRITNTGLGVESVKHRGDTGDKMGSICWEAPLKVLPDDLAKLRFREFSYDPAAIAAELARVGELVGDLLQPRWRPFLWWTQGLTITAIDLIGLETFMLTMYDNPEGLHALMRFLRDETMHMLDWHEQAGVLFSNNRDEYVGSGGCGWTDDLPAKDHVPGAPYRVKDMWGLSESQETVSVSTPMFAEFVFPYQKPIIERFGLAYYGCCEPVDKRWEVIKQIANLRAVSVSPWSNVEKMAEFLGRQYVFCRKPNPAYISAGWDEDVIRKDLRRTIEATKGLSVQLILKDVHTVSNEPWRFARWVEIAREEIARVYGVVGALT
ncbi:MAG: hypothetical protein K8T26_16690 [Lentisphaerae bacterium]|nr:hypothetical protein [Lentisphaerota bacterium]